MLWTLWVTYGTDPLIVYPIFCEILTDDVDNLLKIVDNYPITIFNLVHEKKIYYTMTQLTKIKKNYDYIAIKLTTAFNL